MRNLAIVICSVGLAAGSARAVVPEPDNVFYGLVFAGMNPAQQITAANSNVVIEARATPAGPALASYTMGAKAVLGDYYSLRLSIESLQPTTSPQAFQAGSTVYLTIVGPTGILGQQSATVVGRGQLTRLDLGSGNQPPYLTHPADNSPTDNVISAAELTAYSSAWKAGQAWSLGPNPIPVGYVTRAGALWVGGGVYVFDASQVASAPTNSLEWWATNSPLWWAHSTPATPPPADNSVTRSVPVVFTAGVPLTVTEAVTCDPAIGAYAVEDQPPAGWPVSNISDGGSFDPATGKVKWGLFLDHTARTLSYTVTPPPSAATDANFAGQAGFDGLVLGIGGQNETGPPVAGTRLVSGFSGSGFKLSISGDPGATQTIETSTNLVNWTTLTNLVLDANGSGQFLDNSATNSPQRFYRTVGSD